MNTTNPNTEKPISAKLNALYHGVRTHMVHMAANSDKGTVRAALAYMVLWLLASLSAVVYITHLSSLFR